MEPADDEQPSRLMSPPLKPRYFPAKRKTPPTSTTASKSKLWRPWTEEPEESEEEEESPPMSPVLHPLNKQKPQPEVVPQAEGSSGEEQQPSSSTGLTRKGQKERRRDHFSKGIKHHRDKIGKKMHRRVQAEARRKARQEHKKKGHHDPYVEQPPSPAASISTASSSDAGPDVSFSSISSNSEEPSIIELPPAQEELAMPIKTEEVTTPPPPRHQIARFDPKDYFEVLREPKKYMQDSQGQLEQFRFRLQLTKELPGKEPLQRIIELIAVLHSAFDAVLRHATPGSIAQVIMENSNLYNRFVPTERMPLNELNFNQLAQRLIEAVQSGGLGGSDMVHLEQTTFLLITTKRTKAGKQVEGLQSASEEGVAKWAKDSKGVFDPMSVKNKLPKGWDNMCVPLCLSMGIYLAQNPDDKNPAKFFRSSKCRKDALELVKDMEPKMGPYSVDMVGEIQKKLGNNYHICVYEDKGDPKRTFGSPLAPYHINIFFRSITLPDGSKVFHCHVIKDVKFLKGLVFWCDKCKKGNQNQNGKFTHKCDQPEVKQCIECKQTGCLNKRTKKVVEPYKVCKMCNIQFMTLECLDHHFKEMCLKFVGCKYCNKRTLRKGKPHHCSQNHCSSCGHKHISTSFCFVQPPKKDNRKGRRKQPEEEEEEEDEVPGEEHEESEEPEEAEETREEEEPDKELTIWYADAETTTDPVTNDLHANLLILQRNTGDPADPVEEVIFQGPDCMKLFALETTEPNSRFKKSTIIFHNGARFDVHLWLAELVLLKATPKTVCKTTSLISLELPNGIRCKDSVQFMPQTPLSALPKMFQLEGSKGHFPHRLNTPHWVNFDEPDLVYSEDGEKFPKLEYFVMDNTKPEQLEELRKFHAEELERYNADPNLLYKPCEQLLAYCKEDVRILREGFGKYRQNWLDMVPELEPLDYLTFPSFNNAVFRLKYMRPETICLLPPLGYDHKNRGHSKSANAWLSWEAKRLKEAGTPLVVFRTARKGFEVKMGGQYVDGYGVDSLGRVHVWEFHGCWWHSCPQCDLGRDHSHYTRTMRAQQHLEALSQDPTSPFGLFTFHTMWEHTFNDLLRLRDTPMSIYCRRYKDFYSKEVLKPRDSFMGGRTDVVKHDDRTTPGEGDSIVYEDFVSMYPGVQASRNGETWPIGPPDVYIGVETETSPRLKDSLGIWRCKVLPPKVLKHGVLPYKLDGKLLFPLCRTCAENQVQGRCTHTDEERMLVGTWCTMELFKACGDGAEHRGKGYTMAHIWEQWDWPPDRRDPNLFKDMIRDQYKLKVLASKCPTDPAKRAQLLEHLAELGIKREDGTPITAEDFHPDPALRALAKFSLNNIWGYLGKRSDVTELLLTANLDDVWKKEEDKTRTIKQIQILRDQQLVMMTFKKNLDYAGKNGNIVLASMTTAYARLRLYSVLEQYPDEVLYMDTDSVFLHLKKDQAPPPSSSNLGDLKDEIEEKFGPGHRITRFSALAPKSYTYTVENEEGQVVFEDIKAKGISLSAAALGVINPPLIHRMAEEQDREGVVVPQGQLRRDIWKNFRLYTTAGLTKLFRFSSTKRWIDPTSASLDTFPYGYDDGLVPLPPAHPEEPPDEDNLAQLIDALNDVLAEEDV